MDRIATPRLCRGAVAFLALLACSATAAAGPFTNLVLFGDSLSDIGNISQATFGTTPGSYYSSGRFSNGPVYAESLATGLGLPTLTRSTAGGNDFAYGGARTTGTGGFEGLFIRDVDEQLDQYLSTRTANASTLYLLFAGANDFISGQTNVNVPVNNLSGDIGRLVAAGARQFLVINLPLLGNTPRYNGNATTCDQFNTRTQSFNTALATMLSGVQTSNPALTVFQFDLAGMFNQVLANPADFGLANVTNSAAPGLQPGASSYNTNQLAPNPNQYLFWDDLHPTAAVHAILGQRVLDLFRLPGDFNQDDVVDSADYIMWRNGQSPSRIPDDYNVWRSHFGQVIGSGNGAGYSSLSSVPEPSSIGLVGFNTILSLLLGRSRRRKAAFRFVRNVTRL